MVQQRAGAASGVVHRQPAADTAPAAAAPDKADAGPAPPTAGAVSSVEVWLASNKLDFHTLAGSFRYELKHHGLKAGMYTAQVTADPQFNQVHIDLPGEARRELAQFSWKVRSDQPNPQVRGFRNGAEVVERVGNLRNGVAKLGYEDARAGIRGSSVTGFSERKAGAEFRFTGKDASDVDFFIVSDKMEAQVVAMEAKVGPLFQEGRLRPEVMKKYFPEISKALESFGAKTSTQLGRKADAILLRRSLVDSFQRGTFILF